VPSRPRDAKKTARRPARRPRRERPRDDPRAEVLRLGGRDGERLYAQVLQAADAYNAGRERDAVKILEPLRNRLPDATTVRELLGLALYRDGRYAAAAEELETYGRLTGSIDDLAVLMDCYRADGRWREVDAGWRQLQRASPPSALAIEGRIVAAGALADQDHLDEALKLLRRRADDVSRPGEHHLRLWYALADLEERAGNLPRARTLFDRIVGHDPRFADAAARRAALG
jgi:tetratricopeptide (TPR) repeat protein